MKKLFAGIGLAIMSMALLAGCSSSDSGNSSPQTSPNRTQAVTASPVGTWGTADGASVKIDEGTPWLTIYKDGNLLASDGCKTTQGTWKDTSNGISIAVAGAYSAEECSESWIGLLDTARVDGKSISAFDLDGNALGSFDLVSRDPSLVQSAISAEAMNRGAEIAACIDSQQVVSEHECKDKKGPAPTEPSDESYESRFE